MELLERIAYTESLMVTFHEKSRELSSEDLRIFLDHISEQLANCKVWVANDDHLLYLMAKLRDYEQWLSAARDYQRPRHDSFSDCARAILDTIIICRPFDSQGYLLRRLIIKNLKDLKNCDNDQFKVQLMKKIALNINSNTKDIANVRLVELLKILATLAEDPNKS